MQRFLLKKKTIHNINNITYRLVLVVQEDPVYPAYRRLVDLVAPEGLLPIPQSFLFHKKTIKDECFIEGSII